MKKKTKCSNRRYSSFYYARDFNALYRVRNKTQTNETQFRKIDKEVKSFSRALHSRVKYIFASLRIKISVTK
jgi:hypothetical protein